MSPSCSGSAFTARRGTYAMRVANSGEDALEKLVGGMMRCA